jgi:hypothetical protein
MFGPPLVKETIKRDQQKKIINLEFQNMRMSK